MLYRFGHWLCGWPFSFFISQAWRGTTKGQQYYHSECYRPPLLPLLCSQAWFEMVQMRLQKAKANITEICWSWYYPSSPSSCILLLCSTDRSVSPAMLLPAQSILDSAYINTQCLTNRLRSFNWITRSAAFPLVRLGGSGHGADFPSSAWERHLIRRHP